jgi:hypothetical protein
MFNNETLWEQHGGHNRTWEHVAKHLDKVTNMFAGHVCTSGTRNIWQSKWNKIHGHGEPWEQHKEHLAKVYHWDKIKDHI